MILSRIDSVFIFSSIIPCLIYCNCCSPEKWKGKRRRNSMWLTKFPIIIPNLQISWCTYLSFFPSSTSGSETSWVAVVALISLLIRIHSLRCSRCHFEDRKLLWRCSRWSYRSILGRNLGELRWWSLCKYTCRNTRTARTMFSHNGCKRHSIRWLRCTW